MNRNKQPQNMPMSCSAPRYYPEGPFLHALFQGLNSAKIQYAVMRNYQSLPQSAEGSDLDIIINPVAAKQTKDIIYNAVHSAAGTKIGEVTTTGFFKIYAMGKSMPHPDKWWGQRIDVNVGLVFNGITILDTNKWQSFITTHNSLNVLSDTFAGILGVLKEILNNGNLPSRYLASARDATHTNWQEIKSALHPMGEHALKLLYELIQNDADDSIIPQLCSQLRGAVTKHALLTHPHTSLRGRLVAEWSKVKRYCFPPGIVIALTGVDGAGKSTIIDAIKPALAMATHKAIFVQHLRPGLLPPLARFKGKEGKPNITVTAPHNSTPSGFLGSILRLLYLTTDYILGYWILIRPRISKQPAVVIFDRYAYDLLLDPRRFRINLPAPLIKLCLRIIPKPDLTFCLYGDATTIAARKQELSVKETERQINAIKILTDTQKGAYLLSTENTVQETRDALLDQLMDFLTDDR